MTSSSIIVFSGLNDAALGINVAAIKLLKMKKVLFILFFLNIVSFGQDSTTTLDIPKIGQKQLTWCTPACFEMIIKSFRPNLKISQERILYTYYYIYYRYNEKQAKSIIDTTCIKYCETYQESCTKRIPSITCNNLVPERGNIVLNWFGFSSKYTNDISKFNWDLCKKQLDNGQPIVLFLDTKASHTKDKVPQHSVVVFGYTSVNDHKLLLVNDPWRPCEGCQYAMNFDYAKNKLQGMIYDITKDSLITKSWKSKFLDKIPEKPIICDDKLKYAINILKNVPQKDLNKKISNEYSFLVTQDYYLNFNNLNSSPYILAIPNISNLPNYTFIASQDKTFSTTQNDTSSISITPRNNESPFYILKTIDYCSCSFLCCDTSNDPCKIEKTVNVNTNHIKIGTNQIPYILLNDPLTGVSFTKFKYNGENYIAPITDIIVKDKIYKKDNAIIGDGKICPPFCDDDN